MTLDFKEKLRKVEPGHTTALAAQTSTHQSQQELEESLRSLGYIGFDSLPVKPKG
jgi:hypothetical protein